MLAALAHKDLKRSLDDLHSMRNRYLQTYVASGMPLTYPLPLDQVRGV